MKKLKDILLETYYRTIDIDDINKYKKGDIMTLIVKDKTKLLTQTRFMVTLLSSPVKKDDTYYVKVNCYGTQILCKFFQFVGFGGVVSTVLVIEKPKALKFGLMDRQFINTYAI